MFCFKTLGFPGPNGRIGFPGPIGVRGTIGRQGSTGAVGYTRGYYFTRHSQASNLPDCPQGTELMWHGYSLLYIMGNARAHGQDLGTAGSCLKRFSTMPFMFCTLNNNCHLASRSDYSYWLSTDAEMPADMKAISSQEIKKYISRCAVCESASPGMREFKGIY